MVWPNENSRHADAAFVEASFSAAEGVGRTGAGFGVAFRAVVRAVPKHGVFGDAKRGELIAEPSYLIVKRREASVVMPSVESVRVYTPISNKSDRIDSRLFSSSQGARATSKNTLLP